MKTLGIDIGTTTISAVVLSDSAAVDSVTIKSNADVVSEHPWERIQSVQIISDQVKNIVEILIKRHPDLSAIGFTGQQHGILYVDDKGRALSQLMTWQDRRGDCKYDVSSSYAEYMSRLTGHHLASGYGLVTHFYNTRNGLVPAGAATFCTIQDYVAMTLAGNSSPAIDASDAASFGLFDVKNSEFDYSSAEKIGISRDFLPEIAVESVIGTYRGIKLVRAIGDNQASFIAAAGTGKMLVNVGTGSQFSVHSDSYLECPGLETRPYPLGGYLLVGAALCGGRSYAFLNDFFRDVIYSSSGIRPDDCYELMSKMSDAVNSQVESPEFNPLFCGTRLDPSATASISGLTHENFTPGHLVIALLKGIATELYDMSQVYFAVGGNPVCELCGSGNGLSKNQLLRTEFENLFHRNLVLSEYKEDAACGAAIFALKSIL